MKWYGINVSKFCGVKVGSETPSVAPDFNIVLNKIKRKFNVSFNIKESESVNVPFMRKPKSFNCMILFAFKE